MRDYEIDMRKVSRIARKIGVIIVLSLMCWAAVFVAGTVLWRMLTWLH